MSQQQQQQHLVILFGPVPVLDSGRLVLVWLLRRLLFRHGLVLSSCRRLGWSELLPLGPSWLIRK